jgi:hypothetical protein
MMGFFYVYELQPIGAMICTHAGIACQLNINNTFKAIPQIEKATQNCVAFLIA